MASSTTLRRSRRWFTTCPSAGWPRSQSPAWTSRAWMWWLAVGDGGGLGPLHGCCTFPHLGRKTRGCTWGPDSWGQTVWVWMSDVRRVAETVAAPSSPFKIEGSVCSWFFEVCVFSFILFLLFYFEHFIWFVTVNLFFLNCASDV